LPASIPNLIVIGAQDAGTDVLCRHLAQHPDVELRSVDSGFFTSDRSWSHGIDAYRGLFEGRTRICGESAPSCTRYPRVDGVPARIRAALPDVRLIYLVCDPIERIVSSWLRRVEQGRERRSFRAALAAVRDNPYVDGSRYHLQLEQYWKHFPASQLHVLALEDLVRTPRQAMLPVWDFLGVDPAPAVSLEGRPAESGEGDAPTASWQTAVAWLRRLLGSETPAPTRPLVGVDLRSQLERALVDDVARLRAATGLALPSWTL
jgi:hypothetical protein